MHKEDQIIERYKKECLEFPEDMPYREELARRAGLKKEEAYLLRPIVGENEFKHIIKSFCKENFMPGVRKEPYMVDSHDFRYLKSGKYKANLHIHSQHSDGLITIPRLLAHSKAIADRNARLNPGDKTPFIIALTDHDCVSGVKELLIETAKNPLKYENLRISLGIEISTICNKLRNQKKELRIHTLLYCIDPFDEELNEFADEKRHLKFELAKSTCKKLNSELELVLSELGIKFTLEEAAKIHEMILKGMDEVKAPLTKYTAAKLLFTNYVNRCERTKEILAQNGIDLNELSIERPIRGYKMLFRRPNGFEYNYKEGLSRYLTDMAKEKSGQDVDFSYFLEETPLNIQQAIEKAGKICIAAHPNMNEIQPPFSCFEDTIKKFARKKFGVFAIAHPGRLSVQTVDDEWEPFFANLYEIFKEAGKERAVFYESYYQSYMDKKCFDYQPYIDNAAKGFDLIKSGGLDSHGRTVILRSPYT